MGGDRSTRTENGPQSVIGKLLDRYKSCWVVVVNFTVGQVAAFCEDAAHGDGFCVWRWWWEVFVLRPVLGVYVGGFDAAVAVTLRWVGDVATQSLVPCPGPLNGVQGDRWRFEWQ